MAPTWRWWRVALAACVTAMLAAAAIGAPVPSASAADYPSWDDIQAAKQSEESKAAEVDRVQGLISGLRSDYEQAVAASDQAQRESQAAQQALFEQQAAYDEVRVQAIQAQARADESRKRAGTTVAQLYRSGGTNASITLYLSGDEADQVLYRLGAMGRLGEQSTAIYEAAIADQRQAEALQQQADVALAELQRLASAAADKAQAAQSAQQTVQAALQEQTDNEARLAQQLADLQGQTAELQAQRAAGIKREQEARAAAEAERQRKIAAQQAAAAAADGGAQGDSGGGGGSSSGGSVGAPSGGDVGMPLPYIVASSGYGMRLHPVLGIYRYHYGTDYPVGVGTPALAIADGTVVGISSSSTGGNMLDIRHVVRGQTIVTRYLHLSRYNVSAGQHVSKGQTVAFTGNTGLGTGAHLHFEIHIGSIGYSSPYGVGPGNTVNPVAWLASH